MDIKYIIGLNGYAGSGKDTVALMLRNYGYLRLGFADYLRAELSRWWTYGPIPVPVPVQIQATLKAIRDDPAYRELIWSKPTTSAIREALQWWGTGYRRWLDPTYWVDAMMADIKSRDYPPGKIVISDVRYPNEYHRVKALRGQCWRIERGSPVNEHTSETALDFHDFDVHLHNDKDIESLRAQVLHALKRYDTEARDQMRQP